MTHRFLRTPPARYAGFTMIEMLTATSLLGAILVFALPLLSRVRDVDEATTRQAFALRELRNMAEREQLDLQASQISSTAVPETATQRREGTISPLPEYVQDTLPQARADIVTEAVSEDQDGPPTVRHTMTLSWLEPGRGRRSVQLSWWSFRREEDQP